MIHVGCVCALKAAAFQAPLCNLETASCRNVLFSANSDVDTELELLERAIPTEASHKCKFCSQSFASRNAMFRHLRSDPFCSVAANEGRGVSQARITRQTVAFKIAYHSVVSSRSVNQPKLPEAVLAGNQLRRAVKEALCQHGQIESKIGSNGVEVLSSTQTSVAGQRHKSLTQEVESAATGDVVVISFMSPVDGTKNSQREFLSSLLERTRACLDDHRDISGAHVRVLACKWLSPKNRFHAERSCTQRIYHYLLPMRWLPHGKELENWWLEDDAQGDAGHDPKMEPNSAYHTNRFKSRPPFNSLRLLRDALRSAESVTTPNRRVRRKLLQDGGRMEDGVNTRLEKCNGSLKNTRMAAGRFGALANKERRAWHNFADPNLKGDASPNQEPVWRVLDRARILSFFKRRRENDQKEEVHAILEFRGDDFVHEQVRRVVGTALAVAHGWLPSNVFDMATRVDVFTETALAPPGRLYLEGSRFHFDELLTGKGFFEDDDTVGGGEDFSVRATRCWLHEHLLRQFSTQEAALEEDIWLQELRDTVSSQICTKLNAEGKAREQLSRGNVEILASSPKRYTLVLKLLREIVAPGTWPGTSVARSSVIRMEEKGETKQECCGSFTIVNPNFQGGVYKHGIGSSSLPLGNDKFPDLVDAVFQLEDEISQLGLGREKGNSPQSDFPVTKRAPSSHCAINCNAQFTPHVDSGRGAGQSLSMIVGLGDYAGGELAVEGTVYDIHYRPLEFDGWGCRHWTLPFSGERFSLVWFTPEVKGKKIR